MHYFEYSVQIMMTVAGSALLSLFSAFAKEWLQRLFSTFSKKVNGWREKEKETVSKQINFLMNNQPILILYCTKVVVTQIASFCLMIVAITMPTWFTVLMNSGPSSPFSQEMIPVISFIMTVLFTVVALIINHKSSKRLLLISKALRPFTTKQNKNCKTLP